MWESGHLVLGMVMALVSMSVAVGKKSEGLICNVCNSMTEGKVTACREPSTYFSVNCTAKIPHLKYCVLINGNLTTVESNGFRNEVIGPRRSCEFDLDRYELFSKDQKPGCFKRTIDKPHYLAYTHFHFDGEICLCNDEDNCNSGDTWVPKQKVGTKHGKSSARTNTSLRLILVVYSFIFLVLSW
ncbi:hypothetical protein RvY_06506 [Ramazzottius varieornatus]|uniref:Uncharacterized protein n=1 Tax=Ramazzottius varieornatus TaxID=947166 RepID=A0A1D1UYU0_RAMVA|nr:hypothetical protein RvY_06506 [Ramazzottius varieornatus]